ncbi:MAG TPA: helix-turn-helix transcriptional regulator [Vitreimonas sp.]|nr:helix-turn-helix transcriptional regulator [Vitreimonas sp.]
MDDVRVGRFIRACRGRLGWRQVDLGVRARVSQQEISLLERGHLDAVPMRTLRAVLSALDASVELDVRWRGGAIDRLIDERHAVLVAGCVDTLREDGWQTLVEVTYSVYGERGSIDVLGWKEAEAALFIGEVKSDLTSIEQTQRKHDEKTRLAPRIARDREGWSARVTGRVLVLPETRTSRRRLDRAGTALATTYPLGQRDVRAWLRRPVGSMGGVLLLPDTTPRGTRRRLDSSRAGTGRVSAANSAPGLPRTSRGGA